MSAYEIKKITLPSGITYDLVDAGARELIAELQQYTDYLGVTDTPISDGATTNPINVIGNYQEVTPVGTENPHDEGWFEYDGSVYTLSQDTTVDPTKTYYTTMTLVHKGNIVNFGSKEFVYNGTAWAEFGDMSGLGDLAFCNTATGTYTPGGTITDPTVTIGGSATASAQIITIGGTATASKPNVNVSGSATAAAQSIALTSQTKNIPNVTAVGSMPTYSVDANGVLEITAGATPTLGTDITVNDVSAATASPSAVDITGVSAELANAPSVDVTGVTATAQASSVDLSNVTATASGSSFSGTPGTITVAKPTP